MPGKSDSGGYSIKQLFIILCYSLYFTSSLKATFYVNISLSRYSFLLVVKLLYFMRCLGAFVPESAAAIGLQLQHVLSMIFNIETTSDLIYREGLCC